MNIRFDTHLFKGDARGWDILEIPFLPKRYIYWAPLILLGILLLLSGPFYVVQPEETAVVLRLGKFHRTAKPGLHTKIPLGVEKVLKVSTGRVMQREYGYRPSGSNAQTDLVKKDLDDEARMLTGDLNVVDINWTVQYQIKDPVSYLFNFQDVEGTLDNISESVIRRIAGNRYLDEVLTVGRIGISDLAKGEIQKLMDEYGTGLTVLTVKLQDVNPPTPVKPAFNEVSEALQEKNTITNEAMAAYNTAVPRTQGETRREIAQAEGYAIERRNHSQGEVNHFLSVLSEYAKAPDVTRSRFYLEGFQEFNNRINKLLVVDEKFWSNLSLWGSDEQIERRNLLQHDPKAGPSFKPATR